MTFYERAERLRATLIATLGERACTCLDAEDAEVPVVHEALARFVSENGGDESTFEVGSSWLQVCGDRLPPNAPSPGPLDGQEIEVFYPRTLSGEQRWFQLRVQAGNDGKRRSIVVLTNVNPTAPSM